MSNITFDHKTTDSTLTYFVNELERLDRKINMPLTSFTWSRDIDIRTDISLGDEFTSFLRDSFAASGTQNINGMPWISQDTTTLQTINVNSEKVSIPVRELAHEIGYSFISLQKSQKAGRPIDTQLITAFQRYYQMCTDRMVYVGDTTLGSSVTGLVNDPTIDTNPVAGGAWSGKTSEQIIADVDTLISNVAENSAESSVPTHLLLPPVEFRFISRKLVSSAGNMSVLNYLKENSVAASSNGRPLEILPLKWLNDAGAGATQRMIAYTKAEDFLRFTLVPPQRTTAYTQGIKTFMPYVWAYGQVEFIYPETVGYADGI